MKHGKRSGAIAFATVVASLALVLGASAPASASPTSGSINCPSFMTAHVSFKDSTSGRFKWDGAPYNSDWWENTNATHREVSPKGGPTGWQIFGIYGNKVGTITNLYVTCVL